MFGIAHLLEKGITRWSGFGKPYSLGTRINRVITQHEKTSFSVASCRNIDSTHSPHRVRNHLMSCSTVLGFNGLTPDSTIPHNVRNLVRTGLERGHLQDGPQAITGTEVKFASCQYSTKMDLQTCRPVKIDQPVAEQRCMMRL